MPSCDKPSRLLILALAAVPLYSQQNVGWNDPSPHSTRFIEVEKDVRLEVLDWGGTGRAMVLLAGGGNTAHVFDEFAPKLTAHNHVYGITRRGFGASGFSARNFGATRLGDDVLAVIESLGLEKPILVGHSIAGEELSSIGTRYPDRVTALIYLDAGYSYAFDNGNVANIQEFQALPAPQQPQPAASDLVSFPALQRFLERVSGFRFPEAELRQQWTATPDGRVGDHRNFPGGAFLLTGTQKYTNITSAALVIFANPHSQGAWVDHSRDPAVQKAAKTYSDALFVLTDKQEKAFESGVPGVRVITIANANHYVFLSNETDVWRAMSEFLGALP